MRSKRALTIGDVTELIGVGTQTVRRMIDRGVIKGYRLPPAGYRRVHVSSLYDWMRAHDIPTHQLEARFRHLSLSGEGSIEETTDAETSPKMAVLGGVDRSQPQETPTK